MLAALPEILAGIRMGLIRTVKGVVIGQRPVSALIGKMEQKVEYYAGVRG